MTVLLLALTGVLALLVVGVAVLAWRLATRLGRLEARLAASSDASWSGSAPESDHQGSLEDARDDRTPVEYVITHRGEPAGGTVGVPPGQTPGEAEVEAVPTLPAGQFADVLLRESVIKSAGLFHGVRRALSPEIRNRIRFEMRREVKRSRKQRRADIREARREWEARQRAAMTEDRAA
jgi:hypothetical protein